MSIFPSAFTSPSAIPNGREEKLTLPAGSRLPSACPKKIATGEVLSAAIATSGRPSRLKSAERSTLKVPGDTVLVGVANVGQGK
jgi:hypothetical protein